MQRRAVNPSEFAGLAEEGWLEELLDDVLVRLSVDTAVVLVIDPTGSHLLAVASRGLEEEVRQGFHLPIGAGFAGTIAATRRPMALDEVRPGTVVNPLILARGVRSMAGVPLLAGEMLVGVLHVGSLTSRHFDSVDLARLQEIGDQLANTLNAERALADRTAARALQRSLVPATPPPVEGIEIATRFIPAATTGLGGDWYDVFHLPNGDIGFVMGDVTGSGLPAAVVMGRLRSSLRAYALEARAPGDVLDRLNRKFLHFEPGQLATVLYMTLSPSREELAVATAGHPGPIIAKPTAPPEFMHCEPNPPIGVPIDRPTPTTTTALDIGTTVVTFTDGLFERRDRPWEVQLDRVRDATRADHPETVCTELMMTMIGQNRVDDDTALLVFRRIR